MVGITLGNVASLFAGGSTSTGSSGTGSSGAGLGLTSLATLLSAGRGRGLLAGVVTGLDDEGGDGGGHEENVEELHLCLGGSVCCYFLDDRSDGPY